MHTTSVSSRITLGIFVLLMTSRALPIRLESETLKKIQTPQVLSLKNLLDSSEIKYLGIDYYSEEHRKEVIKEAQDYLQYRRSQSTQSKLKFLANCEQDEEPSAFCDFEKERFAKTSLIEKSQPKNSAKFVRKWILKGDISHLANLKYSEIITAMKSISDGEKFDPLIENLKSAECINPALLNSTAAKLEEYFPDEKFVNNAKALYSKSVGCGNDSESLKAAYRLSLLSIWQNQCEIAEPLLSNVETALNDYKARAQYWRVYCSEKMKTASHAVSPDASLKGESLINFQNILVHGDQVQSQISNDQNQELKVMNRSMIAPETNKQIEAIEAFMALNENVRAAEFTENILPKIENSEAEFKLYLAFLMHASKNSIPEFHILSSLFIESPRMIHESTLKMYFPLEFYDAAKVSSKEIDPLIVLSIIRQESAFNPKARSRVGARGLMQVMPPTAKRIDARSSRKLFDPETNMKVGVKLFLNQVERFDGDFELALAAYNAGRLKVEDWQRRYPSADKMLFLDLIPYRETREYVTMILRNYYWYQRLYSAKTETTKNAYKMPSLIERINQKNIADLAPASSGL